MLTAAFSDDEVGLGIRYRTDGSVLNLRRLEAKTKVSNDIINDFLFADDCALNADTKNGMQHSVDLFSNTCDNFGLTNSTKKTQIVHQPVPGKPYIEHQHQRQRLKAVDKQFPEM